MHQYAKTALALTFALVFSFSAAAEDDAAKRERLAQEIVQMTQVEQMFDQMFPLMISTQKDLIKQSLEENAFSEKMSEAVAGEVAVLVNDELRQAMKPLIAEMSIVYADVLSVEELEGVIAFYRSPAGEALLAKQPQLVEKSMEISNRWAQETMVSIMDRIAQRTQEIVEKYSVDAQ